MVYRVKFSLLLLLFLHAVTAFCADEDDPLSKEQWQELTESLDYGENKAKEPVQIDLNTEGGSSWVNATFVKILVISVAVIVLAIILIRILGNVKGDRKIKKEKIVYSIEEAEEDIHQSDLIHLIDQYLQKKDYRAALRALYLQTLKNLDEFKYVIWKKEKTNYDYVREIDSGKIRQIFANMTLDFEKKWYGEQRVDENDFNEFRSSFNQLVNQVNR